MTASATALCEERFDGALEQLQLAERLRSGPDVKQAQACLLLLAGDFSGALSQYLAIVRTGRTSPQTA
jgi:hypothetical protein